ncbi:MAG: SLC13 family permease [Gammaproteobacteria bacterium]
MVNWRNAVIEFDIQMAVVLGFILLTVILFISEILPIDVVAISILVLLGLTTLVPDLAGLVNLSQLFDGFASNAVISIMAIMIIGEALDRVGVMRQVANAILKFGGRTESRITVLVCTSVAFISSFMQNVGAAALYIPVVARLSAKTEIPITRLLMPMGFCAIMGGTLTMVGSSPLILLNDLTRQINRNLEPANQLASLDMFAVTPIGLCLVAVGILYFLTIGRTLLPSTTREYLIAEARTADRIKNAYQMTPEVYIAELGAAHPLVGRSVEEIEDEVKVHIVALSGANGLELTPTRDTKIPKSAVLGIVAPQENLDAFSESQDIRLIRAKHYPRDFVRETLAGFSEVVIPAESTLVGKSIADIWLRRNYRVAGLGINRGEEVYNQGIRQIELRAGDTLLTFSEHGAFADLQKNRDFIPISETKETENDQSKQTPIALLFLVIALSLVLFSNLLLSLCLWVGALGMILFRVVTIEQAYAAISWKTIFLLASLIPLGTVVETSGTAAWIAQGLAAAVGDYPQILSQILLAMLATFFTLVMSNVGATVLLVPLAVNLAFTLGAEPLMFALIVAISTSNSFLIPTHQVNVLTMGPGGYRVIDFLRCGGILTIIFIAVELSVLNVLF